VDAHRRTGADRTARRGAKPPVFPITAIDDPALPEVLAELAAARADEMDADTVNRELSIARKAIDWWQRQDWISSDPTIGIERRPAPPDRTKALAENQIAALWRLDVVLREKTQWRMLYESAARADEVLCLNVEDLYPQDKRGKITAKGGAIEWIHWQSGTAQLLPRLIARRTRGPLFLTDRKAPAGTPTLDVCPETGRGRLSYRRAEEIFEENTRLLANPLASPEDIEDLDGWTLHRLRQQCPHARRRGRHLDPDAAGPLPPRLRPLPGAIRPPRRRLGRPARRRTRPRCTPPHVDPSGSGLQDHPVAPLTRVSVTPPVGASGWVHTFCDSGQRVCGVSPRRRRCPRPSRCCPTPDRGRLRVHHGTQGDPSTSGGVTLQQAPPAPASGLGTWGRRRTRAAGKGPSASHSAASGRADAGTACIHRCAWALGPRVEIR
jgi:integrase/recombinase XerD